ncbi:MAG: hypothetical protein ACYCVB_05220 [Bacilli bacterium]
MMQSLFPKELLYKEWIQKRWAAVLVCLMIIPSVFFQSQAPWNGAESFLNFCNHIFGQFVIGWWTTLTVVGLAVFSLWSERNRELWWFTLSGPVTKRQVLRAKYTFDLSLIVAVFTLFAIVLAIVDVSLGFGYPLFGIVRWWVTELSIQCSMYALALLLATLIGNIIAVVLLTFGIANIPMYAGIPMVWALGANLVVFTEPSKYYIPLSWKLMWAMTHLSPLNWYDLNLARVWMSPWPYLLWFLIFALLACIASENIYERTNNERLSHFFVFSWTRHPFTLMLSALAAYAAVKTSSGHAYWPGKLQWLVATTLIVWIAVTLVSGRILKRR